MPTLFISAEMSLSLDREYAFTVVRYNHFWVTPFKMVISTSDRFYHREQQLADLNQLTSRPGPAMVLVYGRRRVGKSSLIRRWSEQTKLPHFYWESPRGNGDFVLSHFMKELYEWSGAAVVEDKPPARGWADALRALRRIIGNRRVVVTLDEFPWAVNSNAALPSLLKTAWDNLFADSQIILLISGSHISALEKMLESDSPLYGRLTGKLFVPPFELAELDVFLPRSSLEKRLAAYSIVGGVPDYLIRWTDTVDLMTNIKAVFLSNLSPYRNEHQVIISDVLRRESDDYETILNVVGSGKHDPADIAAYSAVPANRAANVLKILTEVRLVERRIRASVPVDRHDDARYGRYFLADPFLQFYYRFVAANRSKIALGLEDELKRIFIEQLRGYVGLAFERLCQRWVLAQAQAGNLPVSPEYIGSDWSGSDYQADVVAVNWRERQVLVGEAKWTDSAADRAVFVHLDEVAAKVVERMRLALPKPKRLQPWQIYKFVFSRRGATSGLVSEVKGRADVRLLTFAQVAEDLTARPVRELR
jgi:hypothetical protein